MLRGRADREAPTMRSALDACRLLLLLRAAVEARFPYRVKAVVSVTSPCAQSLGLCDDHRPPPDAPDRTCSAFVGGWACATRLREGDGPIALTAGLLAPTPASHGGARPGVIVRRGRCSVGSGPQSRRSDRPSTGLTTSTSIAAGCDIAPCHGPRDSGAARTDSTECLDRPDRSRRAALRTPAELPLGAHWRTTRSVRARKSARDIPRCGLAKEAARAVSRPKRSGELQGAFNPSGALPTANRPEHRALPDRTGLKSHLRTLRNACRAITSSTLSFAPSWLGLPRPITSSP